MNKPRLQTNGDRMLSEALANYHAAELRQQLNEADTGTNPIAIGGVQQAGAYGDFNAAAGAQGYDINYLSVNPERGRRTPGSPRVGEPGYNPYEDEFRSFAIDAGSRAGQLDRLANRYGSNVTRQALRRAMRDTGLGADYFDSGIGSIARDAAGGGPLRASGQRSAARGADQRRGIRMASDLDHVFRNSQNLSGGTDTSSMSDSGRPLSTDADMGAAGRALAMSLGGGPNQGGQGLAQNIYNVIDRAAMRDSGNEQVRDVLGYRTEPGGEGAGQGAAMRRTQRNVASIDDPQSPRGTRIGGKNPTGDGRGNNTSGRQRVPIGGNASDRGPELTAADPNDYASSYNALIRRRGTDKNYSDREFQQDFADLLSRFS